MKKENRFSPKELSNLTAAHLLNAGIFVVVLVIMGLAALIFPKPTVSEYEKRDLEKLPEFSLQGLFSGKYTEKLDLFFADTFPAREKFVELAARQEELRGLRVDDVKIHEAPQNPQPPALAPDTQEQKGPVQDAQPGPQDAIEPPTVPEDDGVEGEKRGSVFIYKDMALPLFGSNPYACERYANTINKYHEVLGDDITIYNLVIPSSIEFYLPEKYKGKGLTSDEKSNIELIYSMMDPAIHTVDAYTKMEQAKDEYIFFRTDHHWTVRGAYAAYLAFCEEAGFSAVPLEKMERHVIENFVGTLYGQTQDIKLKEHPDYVEYFVPPIETTTYRYVKNQPFTPYPSTIFAEYATGGPNSYSVFLHGDFPLTHIKTNLHTGRKIAVVKESFGNAFSPFLVSHYDEVFVVDQRYFQLGFINFLKQNGVTDLLFINNIFAANTDIRINEINRIMYQQFAPPPPPQPQPEDSAGDDLQELPADEEEPPSDEEESEENREKHRQDDE